MARPTKFPEGSMTLKVTVPREYGAGVLLEAVRREVSVSDILWERLKSGRPVVVGALKDLVVAPVVDPENYGASVGDLVAPRCSHPKEKRVFLKSVGRNKCGLCGVLLP